MSNPGHVIRWIVLFLGAVALIALILAAPLSDAFLANPVFNGTIALVLAVGIAINIRQIVRLGPDADWIREVHRHGESPGSLPRGTLLLPLSRALGQHKPARVSMLTMRTVLDGIRSRLDEGRDLSRYFIGLLVFLGLLGTFWGLLDTLGSVGAVIGALSPTGDDAAGLFEQLRTGLEEPLGGMGTAFSSSLFGLGGALVLGFVDLQTGHAQNRFYNELEEWLSGITRSGGMIGEGDQPVPAYIEALLEQTADSLEKLQRTVAQSAEERMNTDTGMAQLAHRVADLADHMKSEQRVAAQLSRQQAEFQDAVERLAEGAATTAEADGAMRGHLRNLESALSRLLELLPTERAKLGEELRGEVRLLARTLAAGRTPGREE